jgi:hypothetical protein
MPRQCKQHYQLKYIYEEDKFYLKSGHSTNKAPDISSENLSIVSLRRRTIEPKQT